MNKREEIVSKAREFIGTPFQHQARIKGVGVDCVGLAHCVLNSIGISIEDVIGYSQTPGANMLPSLERYCDKVSEALPGDIYLLKVGRHPHHAAIASDYGMIHAHATVGKVVEHRIDDKWKKRIVGIYRLKELNV